MLRPFLAGLTAYFRVPATLMRYGLWPYQLAPALISLLLALGLFAACWFGAESLHGWLDGLIELEPAWLDHTFSLGMTTLALLALLTVFVFFHKHLALIILSPLLGKIAEETVKAVKGPEFAKSELSFMQSLRRSTGVNLRYILRELFTSLLFLACGLVPLIGSLVSAIGLFATQSRYLGYGLMDFPLEHRGLDVKQSDKFVRSHRALSTGLGAGYLLLMMIPLIGWMFAPTFGTVAGTLKALEQLDPDPRAEGA
ncbi:MAG: EI24 domain-containing protein [Verrucomicrobiota bacterium]